MTLLLLRHVLEGGGVVRGSRAAPFTCTKDDAPKDFQRPDWLSGFIGWPLAKVDSPCETSSDGHYKNSVTERCSNSHSIWKKMSTFGSEIDTDHSMDSEDFENIKPVLTRSDDEEFELSHFDADDATNNSTIRVSSEFGNQTKQPISFIRTLHRASMIF